MTPPQSSTSIQVFLDKMINSGNKESKIVAIDELLNGLHNDAVKLDEDSERKTIGILLYHIEGDENQELKTLAIKCLNKLVGSTKIDRIQVTAILKSCLNALDSDRVQIILGVASITDQLVVRWSTKFEIYDWDLIINICDSMAIKLTKPSSALAPFTGHPQNTTSSTVAAYHQSAQQAPSSSSNSSTIIRPSTVTTSSNYNNIQQQTSSNNALSHYAMNLSSATANISDLLYHHNNHNQSVSPSSDNQLNSRNNESLEMIQSTLQRITVKLLNESTHGYIFGCDDALYNLIEKHYHLYDETIIIGLLEYRTKVVNTLDERYIFNLSRLIIKSFKNELRKAIRLKSIAALSQIFSTHRAIYEDELMEKIFIPNFTNADQENDLSIRKSIVYLLSDFASMCFNYRHCLEALKIIKKILVKPFKFAQIGDQSNDLVYIFDNADIIDSRVAIKGLTKIFKTKLFCLPIDPAIQILEILLDYLYQTYKYPLQAPQPAEVPLIRQELFSLLLILRANENCQLGLDTSEDQPIQSISEHSKQVTIETEMHSMSESNKIKYSPFLTCKKSDHTMEHTNLNSKPSSPTLTSNQCCSMLGSSNHNASMQEPAVVDLVGIFTAIVDCINQETDYDVLRQVLEGLPQLLANRSLVLSAGPHIVDNICRGLSDLIRLNADKFNKQYPKNNMRSLIYKAMTSLIYYKKELEPKYHKTLLVTFEEGLRLSQTQCISIITMCLIEMHESLNMMRFLPQILMKLSKFSATVHLAPCQLDFLSYLILFPRLCENFAGDEYICIFAIALPFTNPFKFNEYVISMAHRVIAMWFLKCRPTFRKDFVEYIKRNLQSHVIQPFKENAQPTAPYPPVFAQHSTPPHSVSANTSPFDQSRKRSLSLNTENSIRSRFEYRQSSIGSALMAHSSQVPSSPPPNSPSSPSAFSFTNSDPAAVGYHQTNQASSKQLNEELIETCTDLISRYTHGQCSAIPQKNPCADYLIDRNNSQTWLHGNSLITISTSRCNAPSSHGGLCDKCFKLCRTVHTIVESTCRGNNIQQNKQSGEYSSMSPTSPKSPTFSHSNESRLNSKNVSHPLSASSSLITPRSSMGSAFNSISSDSETELGSPSTDPKITQGSLSSNQMDSRMPSPYAESRQSYLPKPKKMMDIGAQQLSFKNKHAVRALFDYHHNQSDNSTPTQLLGNTNNPCNCWCQGWAEILIRRPTGNTCWLTRLQNTLGHMPPISQMINNGHTYNNNLTSIFNTMSLSEVDETSYLSEADTVTQDSSIQTTLNIQSDASLSGSKSSTIKNQRRLSNPDPDGMSMSTTITNSTSTIDSGANSNFASQSSLIITTSNSTSVKPPASANSSSPILQDSDIGSSVASSSIATPTSAATNGSSIRDRSSTISVMSPAQQHLLGQRTKSGIPHENLAASTTIVGGSNVNNTSHNQQITLSDLIAPQTPAPKSHGLHPSFVQLQFFNDCGINTGMLDETATTLSALNSNVISNNINSNPNQSISTSSPKQNVMSHPKQQMKSEMILLPKDSKTDVALKVFDRIQPYETHKIGVVYVGNGQVKSRTEILANKHGSRRYVEFLRNLGTLIDLSDIDTQTHFIGGLDVNGSDGQFTYFWQDSITQVVFHVATLMPIRTNDLQCNEKIRHIGNDHVCIVYNDSGKPFELITIKGEGQCIIACIEITPVEVDTNLITIKALPDLAQIIPTIEPKIVTNEGLSLYIRQTAIHLNLASMIYERRQRSSDETILNKKEPYVSNWVERLRKIKAIRRRIEDLSKDTHSGNSSIMMAKR